MVVCREPQVLVNNARQQVLGARITTITLQDSPFDRHTVSHFFSFRTRGHRAAGVVARVEVKKWAFSFGL
jgi:hypothetical protein